MSTWVNLELIENRRFKNVEISLGKIRSLFGSEWFKDMGFLKTAQEVVALYAATQEIPQNACLIACSYQPYKAVVVLTLQSDDWEVIPLGATIPTLF